MVDKRTIVIGAAAVGAGYLLLSQGDESGGFGSGGGFGGAPYLTPIANIPVIGEVLAPEQIQPIIAPAYIGTTSFKKSVEQGVFGDTTFYKVPEASNKAIMAAWSGDRPKVAAAKAAKAAAATTTPKKTATPAPKKSVWSSLFTSISGLFGAGDLTVYGEQSEYYKKSVAKVVKPKPKASTSYAARSKSSTTYSKRATPKKTAMSSKEAKARSGGGTYPKGMKLDGW